MGFSNVLGLLQPSSETKAPKNIGQQITRKELLVRCTETSYQSGVILEVMLYV